MKDGKYLVIDICLMIDTSIAADRSIDLKGFAKLSKHKDMEVEIEKM